LKVQVGLAVGALASIAAVNTAPVINLIGPIGRCLSPRLVGMGRVGHTAITFDDGPDPSSTPQILAALDDANCRATCFLLGSMVRRAPALAAEIADAGHEIGVHGDRHRSTLRQTPRQLRHDIERASATITAATNSHLRWYRPPYGTLSTSARRAARHAGLEPVLWTSWGRDWRAEATAESVLHDLRRGVLARGTVLLHDSDCTSAPGSWNATLGALPTLLAELRAAGLEPGPLTDHWSTTPPHPSTRNFT
jgi:peptidoglycan/xylan/chitin deacetylase (PgdA/CDA1 family)